MRRWLAIFLLVFMPLQLTWAAVSAYCQHESGAAALHLGHHEHKHTSDHRQGVQPDTFQFGDTDPDCGDCHAGCVPVLAGSIALPTMTASAPRIMPYREQLLSPPQQRPERPNWRVLA